MPSQPKSWATQPKTWLEKTKKGLEELGLNPETLDAIETNHWELVQMLNDFATTFRPTQLYAVEGSFVKSPGDTSKSAYNAENHKIFILKDCFPGNQEGGHSVPQSNIYWQDSKVMYKAVAHLAHEVAHALQGANEDPFGAKYDNAVEYAKAMTKGEGEALYYESIALYKMFGNDAAALKVFETSAFRFGSWKNDELNPEAVASMYQDIFSIVRPDLFDEEDPGRDAKIEALQEMNATMIAREIGAWGVPLTYDENYRWYWLTKQTDLIFDFLEAFGQVFDDKTDLELRNDAIDTIEYSDEYSFYIKTLINRGNPSYLGTIDDDVEYLRAKENGSVLGSV